MKAEVNSEPSVTDEDKNHVAHQIQEGYTSGQFLGEEGSRIAWDVTIDIID